MSPADDENGLVLAEQNGGDMMLCEEEIFVRVKVADKN